jgi:hypothetical protein
MGGRFKSRFRALSVFCNSEERAIVQNVTFLENDTPS